MTTLKKLQYQIERLLSAGPKTRDSKLSPKYIQQEIIQVTNSIIKIEHYQKMNLGERDVNALCIATYDAVAVQIDALNERNYVVMPAYAENLPGGYGIQQVKPQTGNVSKDRAMIPIMPHEAELFSQLLVGTEVLKSEWCFEPDRNRIYFTEKNGETLLDSDIDAVQIKMVVIDPSTLDEDDRYPVSPAQEIDIIKAVLALHGYTAREQADLINDNIPTK